MIIVTHPSKPFPRAGKGTIQRKMGLTLYEDEIEQLYVQGTMSMHELTYH